MESSTSESSRREWTSSAHEGELLAVRVLERSGGKLISECGLQPPVDLPLSGPYKAIACFLVPYGNGDNQGGTANISSLIRSGAFFLFLAVSSPVSPVRGVTFFQFIF